MFDVVIIGAGVTGSAIAREVSRYKLNTCVIEKEEVSVMRHPRQTVRSSMRDLCSSGNDEGKVKCDGKCDDGQNRRRA